MMHYRHANWRYRLFLVSLVIVGVAVITLVARDLMSGDIKDIPVTPTTVIANTTTTKPAKPAKPKPPIVKPLTTVVTNPAIDQYLTRLNFSGTAVVVRNGQVILRKAYGLRDRDKQLPNEISTPYYIGSAQKAIIATAILQLQDAHKLNVNDPINKYLPNFPNGGAIKLKNLLTHTSGIVGHAETSNAITPRDLVTDIEKRGIKAQPGNWNYQDSNYSVLGYLVEKLSHQSLDTYLKQHIYEPAGMTSAGSYRTFLKVTNHSVGYQIKNGQYTTPALPDLSQLYGCGNIYMSANDMYQFDHALMSGKLISTNARQQMFTPGSPSTYGMGFYVNPGSYSNHGVLSGWNLVNGFSHSGQTYVVIMANVQNNIKSFGSVLNQIFGMLNQG